MKQINYRGMTLEVEDWVNYVATDEDGEIWGYENDPIRDVEDWFSVDGNAMVIDLYVLGWEQSLEKV